MDRRRWKGEGGRENGKKKMKREKMDRRRRAQEDVEQEESAKQLEAFHNGNDAGCVNDCH